MDILLAAAAILLAPLLVSLQLLLAPSVVAAHLMHSFLSTEEL